MTNTRAETAYLYVKEKIVRFELLPGTPLNEEGLADELNVSRTPVREALRMLEAENLVVSEPHHGAYVAHISREDILNAYEARLLLEPAMAGKVTNYLDQENLEKLENAALKMPSDPRTHGEAKQAQEADIEFHELLSSANGNRLVESMTIEARLITQRAGFFVPQGRFAQSREEHLEIVSALRQKKSKKVISLMEKHIENARDRMLVSE